MNYAKQLHTKLPAQPVGGGQPGPTHRFQHRQRQDRRRTGALDAKIPRIIFGTYTGDGKRSQDIVLGFQPKALLLFRENDCVSYSFSQLLIISGMAFPGQPIASSGKIGCEITENGFQVYCDESQNIFCNYAIGYHYIAFA